MAADASSPGPEHTDAEMGGVGSALARIADSLGRYAIVATALIVLVVVIVLTEAVFDPEGLGGAQEGQSGYAGAADVLRSLLAISIITGIAAAALVQAMKYLWSVRGWFHHNELRGYLGQKAFDELRATMRETAFGASFAERGRLAGGDRFLRARQRKHLRYVLNLPLEQLTGQLAAAAESAIIERRMRPGAFESLLESLAGRVETSERPGADESFEDAALLQRVQRGIDTLHIVIGHRWRWFLRSTSMFLCAPIAWGLLAFSDATVSARALGTVTATLLGGWFSWFARDIAAAVERWRR